LGAVEIEALAAVVTSAISILSVVYFGSVKLATLQVKVDTMWEFTLRRAKAEAVHLGLATLNSPLVVHPRAKEIFGEILNDLRDAYKQLGPSVTDEEMALKFEQLFGDRLLKEVCIPCGMHMGACLVLAIQVLRDEDKLH